MFSFVLKDCQVSLVQNNITFSNHIFFVVDRRNLLSNYKNS